MPNWRSLLNREYIWPTIVAICAGIFIITLRFFMNLIWMIAAYIGLETDTHGLILPIVILEFFLLLFLIWIVTLFIIRFIKKSFGLSELD